MKKKKKKLNKKKIVYAPSVKMHRSHGFFHFRIEIGQDLYS